MPTGPVSETLHHYRLVRMIGAGGMGEVYEAEDLKLGRRVAVKRLHHKLTEDVTARRRLLLEARAACALDHPNVVRIFTVEEVDGADIIVMEYVEGETLAARIRHGPLPLAELFDLGAQIAEALAAAHATAIVHRDVKPGNVLITPAGQAKVLDFGLARALPPPDAEAAERTLLTEPGTLVGTVAYMSPEQSRGEALTESSDLFSLGSVLYEAATGQRPFHAPSVLGILQHIATAVPVAPSGLRPDLPRDFELLLDRAMAKDPARRIESATAMAGALRTLGASVAPPPKEVEAAVVATEAPGKREVFVGRETELETLERHLSESIDGTGRMVFIAGEPGIGKTALAERFLRKAQQGRPDLVAARGRCLEQYGTGEAYLPFLDALSAMLLGRAREEVVLSLRRHAPTWCLQLPALFGSAAEMEQLRKETIGATKERMLREMGDALESLAATTPVLLHLEDLHWSDPSSVDLIRHLCQRIGGHRLMLIGTFRPADLELAGHPLKSCRTELLAHGQCHEITLDVMDRDNFAGLLDSRFRPNRFPGEFADMVHRKTDGHPLFATSLVQFLVQQGQIRQAGENWELSGALDEISLEVPETVRSMIRRQLDTLREEDRRALQYASVQGEEFLSTVTAGLLETDDIELEERLDRLARAHHVIESAGEEELPDGALAIRYRFTHGLYRSVLYDELASKRRAVLHRETGRRLAEHFGERAAEIAAQLAVHFENGRQIDRAAEFWIQAAERARGRFSNVEATELYSDALRLAEKLPAEQRMGLSMRALRGRAVANLAATRLDQGLKDYRQLRQSACVMGHAGFEVRALTGILGSLFMLGRLEELATPTEEVLRVAEKSGDHGLRALAGAFAAVVYSSRGEHREAAVLVSEENIVNARAGLEKQDLARVLYFCAMDRFYRTEFERAEELASEAAALAAECNDGLILTHTLVYVAAARAGRGRIAEALAGLTDMMETARRNGERWFLVRIPLVFGWIYRELQDFGRALENLTKLLELPPAPALRESAMHALIEVGVIHSMLGRTGEALAALKEAEAASTQDHWFRWRTETRLHCALAACRLAEGELGRAERHARIALELGGERGIGSDVVFGHKLLGEAAMARGDLEEAEQELAAAVEALCHHEAPLVAWKTYAVQGRLYRLKNDPQAAREAFSRAEKTVRMIAGNIDDLTLRKIFLDSEAVREVLGGAAS